MLFPADSSRNAPYALIEGPEWRDPVLVGKWLSAADRANELFEIVRRDATFYRRIERLELVYKIDFARTAIALSCALRGRLNLRLRADSEPEGEQFAVMAATGFFTLIGHGYQMAIPRCLTLSTIERAVFDLAATEDADFVLHPERLVKTMTLSAAENWPSFLH